MLYLAAFLIFCLGVTHSVLGERYILIRLFGRSDLPKIFGSSEFTSRTLRFAWHITTVAWWGLAAILLQLGRGSLTASSTAHIIGWTAILSALLPLVITRGRHLAWLVLLFIGSIALFWSAT
jgi:hypothetical protein